MSKIVVPSDIHGKELFSFLIENKAAIIAQKKAFKKKCDGMGWHPSAIMQKEGKAAKVDMGEVPPNANEIRVEVVANTSMYVDSQLDVLLKNSASNSINQRLKSGLIKQLKDHGDEMDDQIGDVNDVFYQDIPLRDLNVPKPGTAQCLTFDSTIVKSYDEKTFEKYLRGVVNQHSIGLYYVKLDLAINDEDYGQEFDLWNRYYGQLINPEVADKSDYFWAVSEYKLMENSAVLFGANDLTPTLSVNAKRTHSQPPVSTVKEPQDNAYEIGKHLKTIKLF